MQQTIVLKMHACRQKQTLERTEQGKLSPLCEWVAAAEWLSVSSVSVRSAAQRRLGGSTSNECGKKKEKRMKKKLMAQENLQYYTCFQGIIAVGSERGHGDTCITYPQAWISNLIYNSDHWFVVTGGCCFGFYSSALLTYKTGPLTSWNGFRSDQDHFRWSEDGISLVLTGSLDLIDPIFSFSCIFGKKRTCVMIFIANPTAY